MSTILLVADTDSTTDRVHAALSGTDVTIVDHINPETAATTAYAEAVDGVLVEMQVGSMGAMAVARAIRAAAGEESEIPVTILLDRDADKFLAGRSGAANWILKNAPASELRATLGL